MNKELWIHKARVEEEKPKSSKLHWFYNLTDYIKEVIETYYPSESGEDKVDKAGDVMTGNLTVPSLTVDGGDSPVITEILTDMTTGSLDTNIPTSKSVVDYVTNNIGDFVDKTSNENVAGLKTFTDNLTLSADLTHTGNTLHSGTTNSILNIGGHFQITSSDFNTVLLQATDTDTFIKDLRAYGFTFNQGSGTVYNDDTTDLSASASATELASAAAIKTYVDNADANFETTAQLNTRDVNNRNRSNHTGGQLASTIYDFETKVLEYEHTGFKKGGNAPAALVDDTSYFLNGVETTLTLPVINSGGERVQLVSNTNTAVRVYPQTGDSLEGVVNGDYTISEESDVVIFYSDGNDNWYVKNIGEKSTTGWAQYKDTQYTSGSPLTVLAGNTEIIDNNSGSSITSYLPKGVLQFYDSTTSTITPENEGDAYTLRIDFTAENNNLNGVISLQLDIGGAQGIINEKVITFPKGANTPHTFSTTISIYSLNTFVTNGGTVKLESITGDTEVYDINFVITRTHKNK